MLYIDVSHYDWERNSGQLDWESIYDAGVQAVCVRLTYGDPEVYAPETRYAQEMCIGARNAGLFVGGYHNLIRGDAVSMQRQVLWFMEQLAEGVCEWAMVDVEPYPALVDRGLAPTLADAERFALRFRAEDDERRLATYLARRVWSQWTGGVPPAGQTTAPPPLSRLMSLTGGVLVSANYPLKTAGDFRDQYVVAGGPVGVGFAPYGGVVPYVWQYTSTGEVPGASTKTCCDATPGSLYEFRQKTRWE